MRRYVVRRLLQGVLILVILSIAVFALLRLAPGADPAQIRCGLGCTAERLEALRDRMGLHDPYFPISVEADPPFVNFHTTSQYGTWIESLFTGSLGTDGAGQPVGAELRDRVPVTVQLLILTVLITVAVGIPFGIVSAVYRNSPADYSVRLIAILGLAVPNFWLATLVLLIPMQQWGYAPPLTQTVGFFDNPWDNMRQFLPAALVLGLVSTAGVLRLTRSSMLEVMRQDFIRTARSKGLREQMVIGRHALKNSMIPVITVVGLQIATLFGGSVIIEVVFNLDGVGFYFFSALFQRDFQVVQTLTIYIGAIVVLLNLTVDVLYAWLDPRIRYS